MNALKSHRKDKWGRLARRHLRIRKTVSGTPERPRLMVRKTLKHLYAQVIDDSCEQGSRTLLLLSTNKRDGQKNKGCANIPSAKQLGLEVGAVLKERGITTVVFDRGGYRYHGCIKALADAVREVGIVV
ncbi:50S ribosomal protein L18 [Candidatus Poribacteria bacterium]|nr:50S ribosomal protein L18 [Candidatus Poribacteria bacterium]